MNPHQAVAILAEARFCSPDEVQAAKTLFNFASRQMGRRQRLQKVARELDVAIAERNRRITELETELNAQARLHGIGSEREAKQLTRIRELIAQCEKLQAERNAVRVKVEQPLLLRIRKLEDVIEQMALSTNTFEVMRLIDKAWQKILDKEEPPQ